MAVPLAFLSSIPNKYIKAGTNISPPPDAKRPHIIPAPIPINAFFKF